MTVGEDMLAAMRAAHAERDPDVVPTGYYDRLAAAIRDVGEVDRLRAENERLRADCERGRELLRDLSAHHDRHHEWDKVADGLLALASALAERVGEYQRGDVATSCAMDNALDAFVQASRAAMVDT